MVKFSLGKASFIMGPFELNLLLLKLKTKTESTVAK